MFDYKAAITGAARRAANRGIKALGPKLPSDPDVLLLAGPDGFNTRPRAVALWFDTRFRNGMCPASSDGLTLESQNFNDPWPTREFSAFVLGYPGGVGRTSVYHGEPDTYRKEFETILDALIFAGTYVSGGYDDDSSRFVWSGSWYRIQVGETDPGVWEVTIWYLRPAAGELGSS